ncbi:hypothetical protein ACFE04_023342 [Oxalis oulophora]
MTDGGFTVLDGSQLQSLLSTPLNLNDTVLTGAQLLDLADSRISSSLSNISLPQSLKSSAIQFDESQFRGTEFDQIHASKFLTDYINAIADQLRDDPLVVSILDGSTLRLFLEDEDDFAMIAENLFTDLDTEDKGKISRNKVRQALAHMGVSMGVPPVSEFPLLNDILRKHGAEGEEELGQAQFAELLQPVLQELADALAEKHVVCVQDIKVVNGSKLRKLLTNEKEFNNVVEKMTKQQNSNDEAVNMDLTRGFLEKNWKDMGLPSPGADEAVSLLYDVVFADVEKTNSDDFRDFVKRVLEKFAEHLEANPVYYESEY